MALPEPAVPTDPEDDPPEDTPHGAVDFVVVDLETTGTGPLRGDRVTEVAAVRVQGGVMEPVFHSLVNPGQPIPYYITDLTGIDDAMVRDAPSFADIAGELAAHLAGRVFVAHNAPFDWSFLDAEFGRVTPGAFESLVPMRLCTVRLARRLLSHLPRRNLDTVCWHYGIANDGRHRAAGDAHATARVLVKLLADADRAGMWSLESLTRYTSGKRLRRRAGGSTPRWSEGADGA